MFEFLGRCERPYLIVISHNEILFDKSCCQEVSSVARPLKDLLKQMGESHRILGGTSSGGALGNWAAAYFDMLG
jgi:hypothetical protein